jgi:hypothetical protein
MLEQKAHAIAVPLQALNHEEEKTTVYVVNPANQIEDRPITLGIQTDKDAEVLSGLAPGELVIVSDHAGLKPGQEVHPQVIQLMQYQTPQ